MVYRALPITGHASNCYLLWDEASQQAAIIDPSADAVLIKQELENEGLTLSYILLTHGHFDHIYSSDALREKTGAPLYVHRGDARCLTDGMANASAFFFGQADTYRPADKYLADGDTLTLGETTILVHHFPGHSPGCLIYEVGDVFFTGDVLFAGSIGRVDLPGGDPGTMRQSLLRLRQMKDHTICPGHGPKSSLSRESRTNPYFARL